MNQSLTGGGVDGDNMSQASSQSRSQLSGSLLDRIRAKQSGGDQGSVSAAEQGQVIVGPDPTPSQISIPTYSPNTNGGHNPAASNDFSEMGASSMMSGLGFGAAQGGVEGGPTESLLGGGQQHHSESDPNYSMGNYFQTFVMDVYSLFRSMPLWAQVIILAFMIFVVIKLI